MTDYTKNGLLMNNSNLQTTSAHETSSLVSIRNNQVVTSSLQVAETFGKRHKDVLKAIRDLDCTSKFIRRNFAPVKYKDAKGELRPMYYLTRDGFTFLAMGFTGKIAAQFKEAYINAFNEMEKALASGRDGECLNGLLVSEARRYAKKVNDYRQGLLERFGMKSFPASDITPLFVSEDRTMKENLSALFAAYNNNTLSAHYALIETMAKEKELGRIKQAVKDITEMMHNIR